MCEYKQAYAHVLAVRARWSCCFEAGKWTLDTVFFNNQLANCSEVPPLFGVQSVVIISRCSQLSKNKYAINQIFTGLMVHRTTWWALLSSYVQYTHVTLVTLRATLNCLCFRVMYTYLEKCMSLACFANCLIYIFRSVFFGLEIITWNI